MYIVCVIRCVFLVNLMCDDHSYICCVGVYDGVGLICARKDARSPRHMPFWPFRLWVFLPHSERETHKWLCVPFIYYIISSYMNTKYIHLTLMACWRWLRCKSPPSIYMLCSSNTFHLRKPVNYSSLAISVSKIDWKIKLVFLYLYIKVNNIFKLDWFFMCHILDGFGKPFDIRVFYLIFSVDFNTWWSD